MTDVGHELGSRDEREKQTLIAAAAVIVSVIVHGALLWLLAGLTFGSESDAARRARSERLDLPPMHVQRFAGDPLAKAAERGGRYAPAPKADADAAARVDRLETPGDAGLAAPPAAPDAGARTSVAAPKAPSADGWRPRQEIAQIDEATVPDDRAALPRMTLPKIERVRLAQDVVPAAGLAAAAEAAGALDNGEAPAGGAGAAAAGTGLVAGPRPGAALPSLGSGGEGTEDRFGFNPVPEPGQRVVPIVRPTSSNVLAEVDEAVVAAEKAAVNNLREKLNGAPFDQYVTLDLSYWIDPKRPQTKYFRLSLAPRTDRALPVIAKDVVFIQDASGSIAEDRLRSCRKAITELLRTLNTGDRFNVVAFRDRFAYAFPAWREPDADSFAAADKWLGKLASFGRTDVFDTLRSVLTMPRDPARPIIALVVTDGEATSGLTRSAKIISSFTELNGGLVSVYIYGVKDKANAYLIDMLTYGNRGGSSIHTGTRWTAAAGLPALNASFRDPVMSDISAVFAASSRAETYPRLVPNLYRGVPLEIYGACPADQKEIVFSMRGLAGVKAYESVFRLAFDPEKKGTAELRDAWARRRMYALVGAYSATPSAALMREMRAFSQDYDVAIPYEDSLEKEAGK